MLTIKDIMTRDVKAIPPEMSIRSAMDFLVANHLGGAPVVSGHAVLGVVSAADLLSFAANLRNELPVYGVDPESALSDEDDDGDAALIKFDPSPFFTDVGDENVEDVAAHVGSPEFAEWHVLDEHDVSEVMTRQVWSLPSSASAREAATLMETHGIHRVLVVDGGELIGIVTALDITRAVANGRFNVRTYLFNHDRDFAHGR